MEHELNNIKSNAITLILDAETSEELEELKIQFLGKNGALTLLMKEVAKLPKEKRPEMGKVANEVKQILEHAIKQKAETFTSKKVSNLPQLDITEPGIKPPLGHLHLVTQAIREITDIFAHIGYTRIRYPEIEWDWYAFTSLNFSDNHPARDDWETFFIKQEPDPKMGPVVLTPHTSSGQVREMLTQTQNVKLKNQNSNVNIRMLNIAKTYRRQSDVSHTPMFHQFEGLVVGENISIADLKGTLDYFVKSYLGEKRITRIRPYHFQFTEPSFEVDVSCGVCLGKGCKLCKEGWLEVGGAGMVHPNVLKFGNVDPKSHTGFAFGFGVERMLMMKDGIEIDDLRTLYNNNLDFLEQF
jgi:phenylalanyl-tRNA synthetase alpha chain